MELRTLLRIYVLLFVGWFYAAGTIWILRTLSRHDVHWATDVLAWMTGW